MLRLAIIQLFITYASFVLHGTVERLAITAGKDDPAALLLGRGIVMDETACRTLLCFDLTNAAGFHAQLTGLLAGLAFTSIVLILQSSTLSGRGAEAGLISFFSALGTLLIAAFLYGTAAGEELIGGRLAIMVFLAGTASAVAVLELFYGLTWLVRAGGFPNATELMARMSALVLPLMTFVYLAITALNEVSIATGRDVVGSPLFVFLSLLSLLLVLVLLLVQLLWASAKLRRLALWCASRLGPEPWLSLISVGVGLAAGLCGGVILQLAPTITAPDWLVGAIMTMWFGFDCLVVLLVRAIDTEATPRQLPQPELVLSALDADYGPNADLRRDRAGGQSS